MTKPQPNPVCSVCNYCILGITPKDDKGFITCPECGSNLRPLHANARFTPAKLHKSLARNLLLYNCIPPILYFVILLIVDPFGGSSSNAAIGISILFLLYGLTALPVLSISTVVAAIEHARPHPRPAKLSLIPIFGLLYTLPAIALYATIGLMFIGAFN
ncbi:MAG: hypothetical protein JKY96_07170 [Phycisphaerales bacterium]|nr:hypothetical protein [Phycisphaerales bacterium]